MPESLTIRVSAETKEALQALQRVSAQISDLGKAASKAVLSASSFAQNFSQSLKKVEDRLSSLSSKLGQLSAPWGAVTTGLMAASLKAGMEPEGLQIQFRILTGSADKAAKMMAQVREISQTSVFDYKTLAKAAAKLGNTISAVGSDVNQTLPLLQRIQTLALAFDQTTPEALGGKCP